MKPPAWLYRRTRLLNLFHYLRMVEAHSQMNAEEKQALKRYAHDCEKALEIGTYMGISANIIAKELRPGGLLFCIDPFVKRKGMKNPGLSIAERDLARNGVSSKVVFLTGFSTDPEIKSQLPNDFDFIFIDGDHTYDGLANDWRIVKQTLTIGGIVCLHDTLIPSEEPFRNFGSVAYFNKVVKHDEQFKLIDECYSMTVLKKMH